MKNFFPNKFLVLIYSFFFLVPLQLILLLPNNSWLLFLKALLILWMMLTFFQATYRYPKLTLGAFICIVGLLFSLFWFFVGTLLGYLFSFLFLGWFYLKFKVIDKLYSEATTETPQNNSALSPEFKRDLYLHPVELGAINDEKIITSEEANKFFGVKEEK